jgi:cytochrome d ubiquinol oxidase subunit I
MLFIGISALAVFMAWRRKLWDTRWLLWVLISTVVLTQVATLSGWWTAEFGRQPWSVWDELRTLDAASPNVSATSVWISLIGFVILYAVVFVVFLWLLDRKIKDGPPDEPDEDEMAGLPDTFGEIFRNRSRASVGGE